MASSSLAQQLAALAPELRRKLVEQGFDPNRLQALAQRLKHGDLQNNFVQGEITGPQDGEVASLPELGSEARARLEQLGAEALRQGTCAIIVLAGGMATRMGGVVKALVEVQPGTTFLDLRLGEIRALQRRFGKAPPLWLMTSDATDGPIRAALGKLLNGTNIATFQQHLSLRVTPEGDLYLDERGQPSEHAPGHGDLPEALHQSGLLKSFISHGGQVVLVTNLDNIGGTLDPAIIGWHLDHGSPITCEVVDKFTSDRGGIPVHHGGRLCILEEFRIPPSFNPAQVPWFSTNVFHFSAQALCSPNIEFTFFAVRKNVDGHPVVQFERLINEVTSQLPTRYLHMPRTGTDSRFLPVKDAQELELRRAEILRLATTRGMIP